MRKIVLAAILALSVTAPAYADSAAQAQYGQHSSVVLGYSSTPQLPLPGASQTHGGGLPFTGLDLGLAVGGGLLLLGAGLALRASIPSASSDGRAR